MLIYKKYTIYLYYYEKCTSTYFLMSLYKNQKSYSLKVKTCFLMPLNFGYHI